MGLDLELESQKPELKGQSIKKAGQDSLASVAIGRSMPRHGLTNTMIPYFSYGVLGIDQEMSYEVGGLFHKYASTESILL
jgi:hypothetical protein